MDIKTDKELRIIGIDRDEYYRDTLTPRHIRTDLFNFVFMCRRHGEFTVDLLHLRSLRPLGGMNYCNKCIESENVASEWILNYINIGKFTDVDKQCPGPR